MGGAEPQAWVSVLAPSSGPGTSAPPMPPVCSLVLGVMGTLSVVGNLKVGG